jgi:hypothetical protein
MVKCSKGKSLYRGKCISVKEKTKKIQASVDKLSDEEEENFEIAGIVYQMEGPERVLHGNLRLLPKVREVWKDILADEIANDFDR